VVLTAQMRAVVPPSRGAVAAALLLAGVATLAACFAVAMNVVGSAPRSLVELEQAEGGLPPISSTCLESNSHCTIAVKGGSLRLTGINFQKNKGYGSAMAVGYVNGQFVSGRVQLRAPVKPSLKLANSAGVQTLREGDQEPGGEVSPGPDGKEGPTPTEPPGAKGPPPPEGKEGPHPVGGETGSQEGKDGPAPVKGEAQGAEENSEAETEGAEGGASEAEDKAGADASDGEESEQYKIALEAVEEHMEARQKKDEEEAKKIAEAVTRVITSPQVSKKIADLAMDAAAAKVGPAGGADGGGAGEASQTGAVTGGVSGVSSSGYADQPAGAMGPGCGTGCAGMTVTDADLLTVPTAPAPLAPSSTAYYNAWKAGGANVGGVGGSGATLGATGAQQVTVSATQKPGPPQPLAVPDWGYPVQYGVQQPAGPSAEEAVAAIAGQDLDDEAPQEAPAEPQEEPASPEVAAAEEPAQEAEAPEEPAAEAPEEAAAENPEEPAAETAAAGSTGSLASAMQALAQEDSSAASFDQAAGMAPQSGSVAAAASSYTAQLKTRNSNAGGSALAAQMQQLADADSAPLGAANPWAAFSKFTQG